MLKVEEGERYGCWSSVRLQIGGKNTFCIERIDMFRLIFYVWSSLAVLSSYSIGIDPLI